MTTKPADKPNQSKSLIIPIHSNNIEDQLYNKIKCIANHLNIQNPNEITTILTISQLFKNTPFKNTPNTQNQILSQITYLNPTCSQKLSNSAINMIINRLCKKGALTRIEGYYTLNPAFQGLESINQIVFRW